MLLPPVSRLRALEAITVFASGSLALLACVLWFTRPSSTDGTFSTLMALALPIAAISSTALLSYVFHRRALEVHRARIAEAQFKYKARAELNEARYMEKSDLLEITLGHMNQGIAFVNSEGKLLIFNKRAVEYSGLDEAQFASPDFALPVDVRLIFREQWKQGEFGVNGKLLPAEVREYFLTGKGALPRSYVRRRPNGTVLEVRTETLPSGGMVQSFTDITELVAAKDAAEAGGRAKSAFLATMSHEIRTPLNGVLGMAALLRDTGLSSQQSEYVETIRNCGDALLSIIDDILSLSKLESGKVEIERGPVDLAALVRSAIRVSLGAAQAKNLELTCELDPDLPVYVDGDENRLRQVLLNLLGNAVKFTPAGWVRVRARSSETGEGKRLRFEVTDTGIGIADSARNRLFQEFSQADASINRRFGGTGLGLAICKRLVEAMGGAIGVVSAAGAGSMFWVELPLRPAQPNLHSEPARAGTETVPGLRVLVVEDLPVNQKVATGMLRSLGHQVDIAEHGDAALGKIKTQAYDVIFMDMQMPRMDGLQATAAIRTLENGKAVPIVAMTANVFETDRHACLAAGMNDFVAKPMTVQDLAAAIGRVRANAPTCDHAEPAQPQPALEFGHARFEALVRHIRGDALRSIIDGFLEEAASLLEQVEQSSTEDDRARILRIFREAAEELGFSQTAHDAGLATSNPDQPAAIANIRASLQLEAARAQVLLSVEEAKSRAAA